MSNDTMDNGIYTYVSCLNSCLCKMFNTYVHSLLIVYVKTLNVCIHIWYNTEKIIEVQTRLHDTFSCWYWRKHRMHFAKNESLQSTSVSRGIMKLTPLCESTNSL